MAAMPTHYIPRQILHPNLFFGGWWLANHPILIRCSYKSCECVRERTSLPSHMCMCSVLPIRDRTCIKSNATLVRRP